MIFYGTTVHSPVGSTIDTAALVQAQYATLATLVRTHCPASPLREEALHALDQSLLGAVLAVRCPPLLPPAPVVPLPRTAPWQVPLWQALGVWLLRQFPGGTRQPGRQRPWLPLGPQGWVCMITQRVTVVVHCGTQRLFPSAVRAAWRPCWAAVRWAWQAEPVLCSLVSLLTSSVLAEGVALLLR